MRGLLVWTGGSLLLVIGAAGAGPALAAPSALSDRLHARALESFRAARFPEAYGRFVGLANAGHAASARYALWMCENGPALFGKDWDCAPHEVEDWARAAGATVQYPSGTSAAVPDTSAASKPAQPRLLKR